MQRFEDGLDIVIRKGLSSLSFTKHQELYQRVIQVEKIHNESKAKSATIKKFSGGNSNFGKHKNIAQEQGV